MSQIPPMSEPYFSEVTINAKPHNAGTRAPPIKIAVSKAAKAKHSAVSISSESDVWSEMSDFIHKHKSEDCSSDSAEVKFVMNLPNRPISLYVTFYGCKKGSQQPCFETPTIFLSQQNNALAPRTNKIDEGTTSPSTSSNFVTPSPSSHAHSLMCSPQTSATLSSFANVCHSFPSNLRLTPASAGQDILPEYDTASDMPIFSLPTSIYDSTESAVPTSLASTLVTTCESSANTPVCTTQNRSLQELLNQFVAPSMITRFCWSAVFAFIVGETAEEQEQNKKALKCASVPTVSQTPKRSCSICGSDCENNRCLSEIHKSGWHVCRRGDFNPSLLSSGDYFTIPQEFEHIRALVQQNEAPLYGYALHPTPFGGLQLATGSYGDPVFPPHGTPPVLDIERLGHSPNEHTTFIYGC